jgi:cytochrome c-type biogenesis protein CcmH/NrfG
MLEKVMRRTWISAAAAAGISVVSAGHVWSQEKQPDQAPAAQKMQKDRDPPPGGENMDKRAERVQNAAPTDESQLQKPAGKPGSD